MESRKRTLYIVCISEETSNIGNAFLPPPADEQYGHPGCGWRVLPLTGSACWQGLWLAGL